MIMKAAIVFYSFSENTLKTAEFIREKAASQEVTVDLIRVKPKEEEKAFLKQCRQAFLRKTPEIADCDYDLSKFDFIIFASPIWVFTIAPALRTYLEKISDLDKKKTACVLTFGSGAGKAKALRELEETLKNKNGRLLFSKNIKGSSTKSSAYLASQLNDLLEMLKPSP